MQLFGYIVAVIIVALLIWFGGMQYADRDNWTCAYAGGKWDMTVFTSSNGERVFVRGNYC